ncbi:hypothetical protein IG631_12348 [Alternaria alternata]|jgi:hypothetical protein|nr:hypothetical protein IG631_12348 [Alternaria alternata]
MTQVRVAEQRAMGLAVADSSRSGRCSAGHERLGMDRRRVTASRLHGATLGCFGVSARTVDAGWAAPPHRLNARGLV